jgi:hypothetical protein
MKAGLLGCVWVVGIFLALFLCAGVLMGPIKRGAPPAEFRWVDQAEAIARALTDGPAPPYAWYAIDGAQFANGRSSTEVFQKLLDGGYVSDPNLFYLNLPGKTPPIKGQRLKPENVGFDLTAGITRSTAPWNLVPLVFQTGFRVKYEAGSSAVPLEPPDMRYYRPQMSWMDWLLNAPINKKLPPPGIAVVFYGNRTAFLHLDRSLGPKGAVPNFVSPKFKLSDRKVIIYGDRKIVVPIDATQLQPGRFQGGEHAPAANS